MRILFLISQFHPAVGGAEGQIRALARTLAARGHTTGVLTRRVPGLPDREALEGTAVFRAIRTVEAGPLYVGSYLASVAAFLLRQRSRWDLLHVTHVYLDAYAAVLTRPWHGRPVLVRPACAGGDGDLARLDRLRAWPILRGRPTAASRRMLRTILGADAFAATSGELAAELAAAGVPAGRISRVPNGVDPDRFTPGVAMRLPAGRARLGLAAGPLLVAVGRLDPQKDLGSLLAALPEILPAAPAARLLILGEGPERAALEAAARGAGLGERVLFRGLVPDVVPYLQAADVFVLPSRAEGMPNALLEAMAAGLPCVSSRVGGALDLITPGRNGLLVEPGDPAALGAAVRWLLERPAEAAALGRAARETVLEGYTLAAAAERYLAIYRGLCRGGAG